jgi:hypothetical protein
MSIFLATSYNDAGRSYYLLASIQRTAEYTLAATDATFPTNTTVKTTINKYLRSMLLRVVQHITPTHF